MNTIIELICNHLGVKKYKLFDIINCTKDEYFVYQFYKFVQQNKTYFKQCKIETGIDTFVIIDKNNKVLHITKDILKYEILTNKLFDIEYEFILKENIYYVGYIEYLNFFTENQEKLIQKVKSIINSYIFPDGIDEYDWRFKYYELYNPIYVALDFIEESEIIKYKHELIFIFNKMLDLLDLIKNSDNLHNEHFTLDIHAGNFCYNKYEQIIPIDVFLMV